MSVVERLASDVVVGRMIEGDLQTQVSVRAGQVVIGYANRKTGRGFEVGYSPKAIEQFNDHLAAAKRVAEGKGG